MAKKNRKNAEAGRNSSEEVKREAVKKFEIGKKGDDFDIKFRKAAAGATADADKLLDELSRESRADRYNFLGFVLPCIVIVIIGLSFIVISRGDIEQQLDAELSVKSLFSGEYTKNLNEVYETTLPFSRQIKKLGAYLGFLPAEQKEPDAAEDYTPEKPETDGSGNVGEDITQAQTTAADAQETDLSTEVPETTAAPESTEPEVTTTEQPTEPETYETFVMYASSTLNIRLGPSTDYAILGYFSRNDQVDVIEIRDDGWAAVLYNNIKAYVFAEYLQENPSRRSRSSAATEATEATEATAATEALTEAETAADTQVLTDTGEADVQASESYSALEDAPYTEDAQETSASDFSDGGDLQTDGILPETGE